MLSEGGALSDTALGALIGVGPGRGIGLMFVVSAIVLAIASMLAYANPRIRLVEDELPDAIPDTTAETASAGESEDSAARLVPTATS
ncbi:MAG TPA: hypothetical protein VJ793_02840 [Anaerolineae bacterium]|nr:hypothetical protein [Anaerolineae bacterium]